MNFVDTIAELEDLPRLNTIDASGLCTLCRQEESLAAVQNLQRLAHWWLAEDRPRSWEVLTRIEIWKRLDGRAWDTIFKIHHADRLLPIPVFLFLTQHDASKRYPHYQLQMPHGSLGQRLAGSLRRQVEELKDQCRASIKALRHRRLVSISMHEPFTDQAWTTVHSGLAALAEGLARLDWKAEDDR